MDPLSDVLSILRPRRYGVGVIDAAAPWSMQVGEHPGIKCYTVLQGRCWLSLADGPSEVRLSAGDCFLLPKGRPFRIASDLSLPSVSPAVLLSVVKDGAAIVNGGGECLIAGGHFALMEEHAGLLSNVLPPLVLVTEESDRAVLRWAIDRMNQELKAPQPGASLVAEHLAHMMLIQVLRLHLARPESHGASWLFALGDKQMCAALSAIHARPGHPWTLDSLADHVAMSRTAFAVKFKKTVGRAPMDYLTRWRMTLAAERLQKAGTAISTVALALGYASETAFSTAFKRVMGCSPSTYTRDRRHAASAVGTPAAVPAH